MAAFTALDPRLRGNIGADGNRSVILVADGKYTATGSAEFGLVGRVGAVEAEICIATGDAGFSAIFCVEGYNPATGNWDTLANTGSITTTIPCFLVVSPHAPNVVNNSYARVVRERMRLTVKPADAKCIEYSLVVHAQ